MIFVLAIVLITILLAASIGVAASIGILGLFLDQVTTGGRLIKGLGPQLWQKSIDPLFLAVPMYIMVGEIVLHAGIAKRTYFALAQWLTWLPGGLMHANVATATVFATTSGSSVATAATVSAVAYPEIERHGYNESLFLGSIAAGGTLGILIPPSILMILYSLLTNTSILELYAAGILPGLLMATLFSAVVVVGCMIRPAWGGRKATTTWGARLAALPSLVPAFLLTMILIGSVYLGIATPTEAAAVGIVASLIIAAIGGSLSWALLRDSFEGTMRVTGMILFLIMAATFLNFVLGFLGGTKIVSDLVAGLGDNPTILILGICVFYIILGTAIEEITMMLLTIPIVVPIVVSHGIDPVWFGVLVTILMQVGLISPPVGMNLFVVQAVRGSGNFSDVCYGVLPFFAMMILCIGLLIAFPEIALWLPQRFYQ